MEKNADEQLIEQYIQGDEDAFQRLVEKYLKPLYNFVYRMIQNRESSEDIVQEVFVKVWKKIASFDRQKKFSTWIFAIAKNATYDFLKKKKAVSFSTFENLEGENILNFIEDEEILYSQEFWKKMDEKKDVQAALNSLTVQARTILLLRCVQGFSLFEIAEIMSQSPNTIKSKYRRAVLWLRKNWPLQNSPKKNAPKK